jgi:bacteriorhodopsin
MADIDIVHKKRTSVWLWVVLAIVVLAVIVWWLATSGQPQTLTEWLERSAPWTHTLQGPPPSPANT